MAVHQLQRLEKTTMSSMSATRRDERHPTPTSLPIQKGGLRSCWTVLHPNFDCRRSVESCGIDNCCCPSRSFGRPLPPIELDRLKLIGFLFSHFLFLVLSFFYLLPSFDFLLLFFLLLQYLSFSSQVPFLLGHPSTSLSSVYLSVYGICPSFDLARLYFACFPAVFHV